MKNKRALKTAVPEGPIWWGKTERHPLHVHLGREIYRQRTLREWSLGDLAEVSGVAKSYLCVLERGLHSPTLEVMMRLEAAFGMVRGGMLRLAQNSMRRGG